MTAEQAIHWKVVILLGGPGVIYSFVGVRLFGFWLGILFGGFISLMWIRFMDRRLMWAKDQVDKVLASQGMEEYSKLIPYEDILARWWCWDIEKCKNK